jgi:hypothetical protein
MAIPANGSLLVSPVEEANVAKLTQVGARGADGLPSGSGGITSLITRAYDLMAAKPLRDQLIFDNFATVRPTRQSHNGAVVRMNFIDDLDDSPTTALLPEDYDVLPTPLKAYWTDITMYEYGRVVTTTNLARGTSNIPIDPAAAERIGRNAGSTVDKLAVAALYAAGGVNADGTAGAVPHDATVATKPSATLRAAAEYFQSNKVEPFGDGLFLAVITPAMETALRSEADAAGWRYWQVNQLPSGGTSDIATRGTVALGANRLAYQYEGFLVMPSIRLTAGKAIFLGNEGLAKAYPIVPGYGPTPQTVVSPVVDRLRRFASVGWTWLGGYARYRAEAVCTGNLSLT